ncbi:hypothetical protein [Jeotgalibacillus salarius]|uniref:Uncharacterized protein n=1 Tax=Jeotgalibacillus salarius TaxID=546023 RepID=A0A4Y8L9V8_9BACL|nr:hypothetical protein [Jeotgalibacillus salarius]TFD99435.1 hypothetical protein E2626_14345 [Jeotgalibacillus salarius]
MTRGRLNGLIISSMILAATGFILLFFSVNFGTSLADKWLFQQGGADTATYLIIIESYINNFIVAGGILLGIGLATIIFSYYKILSAGELK